MRQESTCTYHKSDTAIINEKLSPKETI